MSDTMDKLPITDPSIRIVPSKELRQFIGSKLSMSPSVPATVREIYSTFNAGKRGKASKNKLNAAADGGEQKHGSIDFTPAERDLINHMAKTIAKDQQCDVSSVEEFMDTKHQETSTDEADATLLNLGDIKWLYGTLNHLRQTDQSVPYLHALLRGCELKLPQNPIQERNPELEARCQRLRKEQEDREYHRMTKNVDSIRKHMPEETLSYQMKQINRHLIAVAQFLFSVAAGFAFGFVGIELLVGQLDFGFRLLLGIIIALIIALAEIYFLAKKLNEEYELPPAPAFVGKDKPSTTGTMQRTLSVGTETKRANKGNRGKEHDE
ncbi:transmembrane protein 199 [Anopheles stephensi]|uniref:transmembrane protein 199 n=1 Tax=Anopheles stephensi TaxID=30069 RepID=UPI0016589EA9|nr:transmembrane protein 199 [Anopheles stephensi]